MKTKKTIKRRGAERIYNQIANMTLKEQLAFWRERTELLRKDQQTVKMKSKTICELNSRHLTD